MAHLSLCRTWRPLGYAVCSVEFPPPPGLLPVAPVAASVPPVAVPGFAVPPAFSVAGIEVSDSDGCPTLESVLASAEFLRLSSSWFSRRNNLGSWLPEGLVAGDVPTSCMLLRLVRTVPPDTVSLAGDPCPSLGAVAAPGDCCCPWDAEVLLSPALDEPSAFSTRPADWGGAAGETTLPPCEWTGGDGRRDGAGRGAPCCVSIPLARGESACVAFTVVDRGEPDSVASV